MEYVLSLSNVYKSFSGVRVLDGVSMEIKKNAIHGIMGPNGAGKSTLFNCITGIYLPEGGDIFYEGISIKGIKPFKISSMGIVRTFQNIRLFNQMNVFDNILAGCHNFSAQRWYHSIFHNSFYRSDEKKLYEFVGDLIDEFDLYEFKDFLVTDISYGLKKKVELLRALATRPKLLILDEPAAGLNETETFDLARIIEKICERGVSIIVVDHDVDMLFSISSFITVINFGKVVVSDLPHNIQQNKDVIDAYIGIS